MRLDGAAPVSRVSVAKGDRSIEKLQLKALFPDTFREAGHFLSRAIACNRISCLKMSAHSGKCVRYLVGSRRQRSTALSRMAWSSKRVVVLTVIVAGMRPATGFGSATTLLTSFGITSELESWAVRLS